MGKIALIPSSKQLGSDNWNTEPASLEQTTLARSAMLRAAKRNAVNRLSNERLCHKNVHTCIKSKTDVLPHFLWVPSVVTSRKHFRSSNIRLLSRISRYKLIAVNHASNFYNMHEE